MIFATHINTQAAQVSHATHPQDSESLMKQFRSDILLLAAKAALLLTGSAALLLSCKSDKKAQHINPETLITMQSENLRMMVSRNGLKSYNFTTPLMEQYDQAIEPYSKYPQGIYVETFRDSTEIVDSTIRADEAVYYLNRKLWMANGNVVATGSGNTLYTEQLFWDEKTDRVYSNVRVRVVDQDGEHIGEGFESDVEFKDWVLDYYEGTLVLDTSPNDGSDSTATSSAAEPVFNRRKPDAAPTTPKTPFPARKPIVIDRSDPASESLNWSNSIGSDNNREDLLLQGVQSPNEDDLKVVYKKAK